MKNIFIGLLCMFSMLNILAKKQCPFKIEYTADKKIARAGDFVDFKIKVTNVSGKKINLIINGEASFYNLLKNQKINFDLKNETKSYLLETEVTFDDAQDDVCLNITVDNKFVYTKKIGVKLHRWLNYEKKMWDMWPNASKKKNKKGVPALEINTIDTMDPVDLGLESHYIIYLINEGTVSCYNVKLICRIPENTEFVKTGGRKHKKVKLFKRKYIVFKPVKEVKPGEKIRYVVTCKFIRAGSAKFSSYFKQNDFKFEILDEEGTSCYDGSK